MSDKRLDQAIDRAVREMMSVDAPADVRARVMSRLQERATPSLPWFTVAAGASLAAAVLAAFVMVRSRDAGTDPGRAEPARQVAVDTGRPAIVTPAPREAPRNARPVVGARRGASRRTVAAADLHRDDVAGFEIDPLAAIDPIALSPIEQRPIEQRSIAPPSLTVTPLTPMTQVHVELLTPPRERD